MTLKLNTSKQKNKNRNITCNNVHALITIVTNISAVDVIIIINIIGELIIYKKERLIILSVLILKTG